MVSLLALTSCATVPALAPPPSPAAGEAPHLWAGAPAGSPPPAPTRRLTRDEYVNTIHDVLGLDLSREPAGLPRDPAVTGFRNDASTLQASDTRIAAYERMAMRVSSRAKWIGGLDRFATCTAMRPDCQRSLVETMGRLLARRPLVAREAEALTRVFQAAQAEGDSFEGGSRLVLRALLQSPAFLYRVETAQAPASSTPASSVPASFTPASSAGYGAASRLSFLLCASGPDAALLDAAAAGLLDRPQTRAEIVERMLHDPRSRRGLAHFAEDWLGIYRLDDIPRDSWRVKGWTTTLNEDMKEQTRRFVVRLGLDEGADLRRLFTDTRVELTPTLAAIYDVPAAKLLSAPDQPDDPFRLYDLAADPRRAGLLTQPAVLGAFGGIDHASIVDRGLFVLRAILCEDVAAPSDDLIVQFKDVPGKLTDRQKFEIHSSAPTCAKCHLDFDGLGQAFEPFDVLGRHRKKDNHGNVLLADGDVFLDGKSHTFPDARAFSALLAQSAAVERCLVSKVYQYAYGREPDQKDQPAIGFLTDAFRKSGRTYRGLVHALSATPAFGGPVR